MVIDTDVVHSFSLVEMLTLCDHLGLQTSPDLSSLILPILLMLANSGSLHIRAGLRFCCDHGCKRNPQTLHSEWLPST